MNTYTGAGSDTVCVVRHSYHSNSAISYGKRLGAKNTLIEHSICKSTRELFLLYRHGARVAYMSHSYTQSPSLCVISITGYITHTRRHRQRVVVKRQRPSIAIVTPVWLRARTCQTYVVLRASPRTTTLRVRPTFRQFVQAGPEVAMQYS